MKKFSVCICMLLFILIWVSGEGQATSLGDLFDGNTITIGDNVFSDWELLGYEDTLNPSSTAYMGIEVTGLTDQALNPGLKFDSTGILTVSGKDQWIYLDFSFTVTSLGPLIKDNSLEITGYDFGTQNSGGAIYIDEWVYDPTPDVLARKTAVIDNLSGEIDLLDVAEFTPQESIIIEKYITVVSDFSGETVSLNSFEQRFSQVPEPGTALLLGTGLLGFLGAFRKRQKV